MKDYIYLPPSRKTAEKHLNSALGRRAQGMSKREFLKAYCSLAYLYPGFHPDDIDDSDGPHDILPLAREAWRRAVAGQLTDNELYPYQAVKAAIRDARAEALAQCGGKSFKNL
jgi:hypothetical protein